MKSKIRNFQIQTRLGSGSYGVIFKAINKLDKQQCVLKQIRMTKMSEKAKKSTLNEATIMGKLIHPFIVQYKDSFVEQDSLNIVMQYCDNGDLSMYLKMQNKKSLKQQKIWKFFLQICLGLEYIHKNKILHRDIKTLNIFLNKNEDVKIGDLGVAKMLMVNDFAQTIVGTPFYLSPQLCQEKPYNQKSDIWALGCLLYELCTYKHPFQAANQASLILKIIRGKYSLYSPIPQFYSKQLKQVIDACLQRDYKRRPTASMILQRPRVRDLIKEFKFQQKVKQEYERIKSNKENKKPQQNAKQSIVSVVTQKNDTNCISQNYPKHTNNIAQNYPKHVQQTPIITKKVQVNYNLKIPSISGMPQKNIILPDKNKIIQKLELQNNIGNNAPNFVKKQTQPIIQQIKSQSSQRKIKQNREIFKKNLQQAVNQQQKPEQPLITEQKNRLKQIDMKIQQQSKIQQQIQKHRLLNIDDRVNHQKPSEKSPSFDSNRKSVPTVINSKQISNKQATARYPKNPIIPQKTKPIYVSQSPILTPPLPPKPKQQVIKIKMQQPPISSKVYQVLNVNKSVEVRHKQPSPAIGIIKSKGFAQELKEKDQLERKQYASHHQRHSVENINKPTLFGLDQQEMIKKQNIINSSSKLLDQNISQNEKVNQHQYRSERNIKVLETVESTNEKNEKNDNKKKQPERYLFQKKKPTQQTPSYGPISRVRKGSSNMGNQLSRNAKNASKLNQVTKEDQDFVANLPNSLKNGYSDDSSEDENKDNRLKKHQQKLRQTTGKIGKKFQLKDINNQLVLQKYQQILGNQSINDKPSLINKNPTTDTKVYQTNLNDKQWNSKPKISINKNLNSYDQFQSPNRTLSNPHQKSVTDDDIEQLLKPQHMLQKNASHLTLHNFQYDQQDQQQYQPIEQNQSLAFKMNQYDENENDKIIDESDGLVELTKQKQINFQNQQYAYELQNQVQNSEKLVGQHILQKEEDYRNNGSQKQFNPLTSSQWSFDQDPQLPMLEDKQSPFFEEANPYLMDEQSQQEEQELRPNSQSKRIYLQTLLEQNIKREDQINKLMQIKIEQCRQISPKHFQQILVFFRTKINKDDEYTENDEKQVQQFLRNRGLTDQRKFQNIYKIMHFQMQLENTGKIIQRICKKLSELDTQQKNKNYTE